MAQTALAGLPFTAKELFTDMAVAVAPVARGLVRVREAAAAAREIMTDLPMDGTGVATLSDRWRSVTRHLLAGVGCELGQIVFPYLEKCTELERTKILETVRSILRRAASGRPVAL
ncbi:hypothetical protein OG588_48250 [Streptomyces prunicolor]|uniref:hypothetical protein n=1 Tax=Streptomyces prunicolor TaxID=67348 RepID=UPI003869E87B|nr:hypothetical protein OG588_48250 [Streptomyces prunicolor]